MFRKQSGRKVKISLSMTIGFPIKNNGPKIDASEMHTIFIKRSKVYPGFGEAQLNIQSSKKSKLVFLPISISNSYISLKTHPLNF